MVLSYAPCNVSHLSDLITLCWDLTNTRGPKEQEEIFLDLLDGNFCKHIYNKGKNKNKLCLIKHNVTSSFCKKHTPKKLIKCSGKNRNGKNCNRNVKKEGNLCIYCIKKNVNVYKCKINISNIFILENSYKYNNCIVPYHNIFSEFMNEINIFINKLLKILNKYKIPFDIFYMLLIIITGEMEHKMQFHLLKNKNIIKSSHFDENKKIIPYTNKKLRLPVFIFNSDIYKYILKYNYDKTYNYIKKLYNKDFSNIKNYFNFKKTKNYIDNVKKRERIKRKKTKEKQKPLLSFDNEIIKIDTLNNKELSEKIDCGYLSIRKWPLRFESYKNIIQYNIHFFHNYYNLTEDANKKCVILFYKINGNFNSKSISYKELYDLFIIEYNSTSVLKYIKYYFKNFKI